MTDEAMDNIVKLASAAEAGMLTEDSAALEFTDKYRGKLLYDHDVGAWSWTESHWQQERTRLAYAWARNLVRKLPKIRR
jgi:putative DNA primase/helicase